LHESLKKCLSAQKLPVFRLLLLAALCACKPTADVERTLASIAVLEGPSCGDNGALTALLVGGIGTTIS